MSRHGADDPYSDPARTCTTTRATPSTAGDPSLGGCPGAPRRASRRATGTKSTRLRSWRNSPGRPALLATRRRASHHAVLRRTPTTGRRRRCGNTRRIVLDNNSPCCRTSKDRLRLGRPSGEAEHRWTAALEVAPARAVKRDTGVTWARESPNELVNGSLTNDLLFLSIYGPDGTFRGGLERPFVPPGEFFISQPGELRKATGVDADGRLLLRNR